MLKPYKYLSNYCPRWPFQPAVSEISIALNSCTHLVLSVFLKATLVHEYIVIALYDFNLHSVLLIMLNILLCACLSSVPCLMWSSCLNLLPMSSLDGLCILDTSLYQMSILQTVSPSLWLFFSFFEQRLLNNKDCFKCYPWYIGSVTSERPANYFSDDFLFLQEL